MSDLIERLRETADRHDISAWDAEIMLEAATRIAELEAEVARLRAELKPHRDREDLIRRHTDPSVGVSALAAPDTGGAK